MKRITFNLTDKNNELLTNIAFLKKQTKSSILNTAVEKYLKEIIKKENLQEKMDSLK